MRPAVWRFGCARVAFEQGVGIQADRARAHQDAVLGRAVGHILVALVRSA